MVEHLPHVCSCLRDLKPWVQCSHQENRSRNKMMWSLRFGLKLARKMYLLKGQHESFPSDPFSIFIMLGQSPSYPSGKIHITDKKIQVHWHLNLSSKKKKKKNPVICIIKKRQRLRGREPARAKELLCKMASRGRAREGTLWELHGLTAWGPEARHHHETWMPENWRGPITRWRATGS